MIIEIRHMSGDLSEIVPEHEIELHGIKVYFYKYYNLNPDASHEDHLFYIGSAYCERHKAFSNIGDSQDYSGCMTIQDAIDQVKMTIKIKGIQRFQILSLGAEKALTSNSNKL